MSLLVYLLVLAILLILWWAPKLQVSKLTTDRLERFDKENEARKTLATIIGGFAIVATVYSTTRALDATREGQITDRYTKAIEQLGATKTNQEPNIEVRLGGIYALVRIAKDSARDSETIDQVLTAYMRHNIPAKAVQDCADTAIARADLQAITSTLGDVTYAQGRAKRPTFHLGGVSFCGFSFSGRNFDGSYLTFGEMRRAAFREAKFRHAWMEYVDFSGANLQGADLTGAILRGAVLSDVDLRGAMLTDALLTEAKFKAARLEDSNLSGANLDSADFEGVNLERTHGLCREQLSRAKTDRRTSAPNNLLPCSVTK